MVKPWTKVVDGKPVPSIIDAQDRKTHRELKRPIAAAYSLASVSTAESFIDDTIAFFVKRLDELFISGPSGQQRVPIADWLQYCMMSGFQRSQLH